MSKFSVQSAGLAIALSGALAMNVAQAMEPGIYLGIDGGRAQAKRYCDNITDCDNSDTSLRGELGFKFNRVLALELGYTSFGTLFNANNSSTNASQDANAWTASLLAGLPVGNVFSIYGRVGAAHYQLDSSGTVQGLPVESHDDTKPYFGAGIEFDLTKNFMLRAEYQRYKDISGVQGNEDDVQAWYGGVGFRF
jgi:OOP family OmpA-OmpF porin